MQDIRYKTSAWTAKGSVAACLKAIPALFTSTSIPPCLRFWRWNSPYCHIVNQSSNTKWSPHRSPGHPLCLLFKLHSTVNRCFLQLTMSYQVLIKTSGHLSSMVSLKASTEARLARSQRWNLGGQSLRFKAGYCSLSLSMLLQNLVNDSNNTFNKFILKQKYRAVLRSPT